jgi:two-component system cell cycle response regulator
MRTNKYKQLMGQRIVQTIGEWSAQVGVEEQEMHRFFHNLKGTSGTLGLTEIERYSKQMETAFLPESDHLIQQESWERALRPVIGMLADEQLVERQLTAVEAPAETAALKEKTCPGLNRVLIIDDDIGFVTLIKEELEKNDYPVSIALDAERGLKLFYDWKPNLILLDYILPDKSGLDVLHQMIEKAKQSHIPIMMISADASLDKQIAAYETGAMDYLAKPLDIKLLLTLLANRLAMKRDWERSITLDELTGAYNRRYFNHTLKQMIDDFSRNGGSFTLVMLDLDHFKKVNDTYGHLKGDEVLQAFVAAAQQVVGKPHIVCRYGGEEFSLLMPDVDAAEAKRLLERLHRQVQTLNFQSGDYSFKVTFSAGISQLSQSNRHSEKLIEEADQALYRAKRTGRNQSVIYSEELPKLEQESPLHIMVVDDDPLMREIVVRQFSGWSSSRHKQVNIASYPDGTAFMDTKWYCEGERHIILLDCIMPGLDGIEVLSKLRASYPEQGVYIVMLTARSDNADIIRALQQGADDYVVKPFHLEELVLRIERLANRQ